VVERAGAPARPGPAAVAGTGGVALGLYAGALGPGAGSGPGGGGLSGALPAGDRNRPASGRPGVRKRMGEAAGEGSGSARAWASGASGGHKRGRLERGYLLLSPFPT
jgi:hypothetical protein